MRQRALTLLVVLTCVVALGACKGKKRPPAATNVPPPVEATTSPTTTTDNSTSPLDNGTDFTPITEPTPQLGDWDPVGPDGVGPLADIHFGYDQATLSEEARATLEKHALWLQNHRDAKVVVEGHCDERGTVDYNLALGEQRARAAWDYLKTLGVSEDRLRIVSFGKEKPLDPGNNEAAWARNRRAHFALTR
jgi:peptidoglycan-associated lipoprotein